MSIFEFYRGKRVFVTGHTGFKGAWLCRILKNAGAIVTGYSLEPPTDPSLFALAGIEGDVCSVIGDIRDFDRLYAVFQEAEPEIVLHLAAQPIVRESYRAPAYTYETNVMGTVNILECVRQSGKVRSFLDAILTGGTSPVPTSQIIINQAIIDGIAKSAELGREIRVEIPEI